ncbi:MULTISPECIES: hypothetical protein [Butyricimonas]|uniref:hypothetical protein n=1 Tax=Butyricimonas TaxID=574697 RepID=UPI0007FB34E9|nr:MULTISPECIES: hypothetical protein [Butyricimonas]
MDAILDIIFKHKIKSILVCIVFLIWIVYKGFFTNSTDTSIGVISALVTTLGFILTIIQLKSVKEISLNTQKEISDAVKDTQDRIKEVLSVSEFTNAIRIIEEIETYIRDNKYEIANLRLKEIYKLLLAIEARKELASIYTKNISSVLKNISLDINNLSNNIESPERIDKSEITPNLTAASTILFQIENYLKSKTYDPNLL